MPAFRGGAISRVMPAPATARRHLRSPKHTFNLEHRAFQIQPCLIAPVLPGESLDNLLLQARVVTDPIKNPLIGWHLEYYFFYVKHRDLDEREELVEMMLNPSWDDANVDTAATTTYNYTYNGAIDWVRMCLNRVVDCYFRDDDEDHTVGTLDNLPLAQITTLPGWLDSYTTNTLEAATDVEILDATSADVLTASALQKAMQQWELLRAGNLTQQSYEEYLATYGIRLPQEELHRPELIRFVREWQYPSNTVNPATGAPSSAVSWSVAERADKRRFFREPGFIFGVTVARPKLYISGQQGAAAGMLNNVYSWLPAVLSDDPHTSIRQFADAAGAGPLQAGQTEGYWIDVKDLFIHGDQFVNYAVTAGTPDGTRNIVALPTAAGGRKYVSDADLDALFVADASQRIRQDGVVSISVASRLEDTSHGVIGMM